MLAGKDGDGCSVGFDYGINVVAGKRSRRRHNGCDRLSVYSGLDLGLLRATMVLIVELVPVAVTGSSEGRDVNQYN